jgi:cytoskeletal protein CcmA (bactofilin family)
MKLQSRLSLVMLLAAFFLTASTAQSKKNDSPALDNGESVGQRIGYIVEDVINSIQKTISGRSDDEFTKKSARSSVRAKNLSANETDVIVDEDTSVTYEGNTVIEKSDTVNSNVIVKAGTLTVYGRINGDVLVVGGDLKIRDNAYIRGNVKIINGEVTKDDDAVVVGYIDKTSSRKEKAYREETKDFRRASTRLNANWVPETTNFDNFLFRYNRVEGLFLGAGSEKRYYWDGQKLYSLYGSVGYGFKSHNWRGNLGLSRQFAFDDGQLFEFEIEGHSLTDSKENWLIGLGENTGAAFFIHEDFRDYFQRNGFGVNVGYAVQQDYLTAQVKAGYLSDEYTSMTNQTEWSLFGGNKVFRLNPLINEGMMRSFVGSAGLSTVTTTIYGPEGWSIHGTAEVAKKNLKSDFEFNQYVGDLRRFQPLGRYENLNVRARVGSSEGALPIQKAFDMGGLGTIPAFPFKGETGNRMLLVNAELIVNGDFLGDLDFWPSGLLREVNFVVFSDAGLVRTMPATAQWSEGFDNIRFSDFQNDVGVGIGTRSGTFRIAFVWRTDRSEPARLIFRFARPF